SAIAGALEAGDEIGGAQLLEVVERQLLRRVHQTGDLELEGRRIDFRMAVVLRGRELVFRRELPGHEGAHVEPPAGRACFPRAGSGGCRSAALRPRLARAGGAPTPKPPRRPPPPQPDFL